MKNNAKEKRELRINDVVLIQDDKITLRTNWGRGKVEEMIVGRDSKIRGAVLRVYNKTLEETRTIVFIEETRTIVFKAIYSFHLLSKNPNGLLKSFLKNLSNKKI